MNALTTFLEIRRRLDQIPYKNTVALHQLCEELIKVVQEKDIRIEELTTMTRNMAKELTKLRKKTWQTRRLGE